jgi:hypothetical protein
VQVYKSTSEEKIKKWRNCVIGEILEGDGKGEINPS